MVGAEEGEVVALAHLEVFQVGADARVVHAHRDEHAARHRRPLHEIDRAGELGQAAVRLQRPDAGDVLLRGLRADHAALHRRAAGGVGRAAHLEHRLGAVHVGRDRERVLVRLARRLGHGVGGGGPVERVVLALADHHHLEIEHAHEVDQLGQAARLVAGGDGVEHARVRGQLLQDAAHGHVRLDVHHHDVLAVVDAGEGGLRAGGRGGGDVGDDVHGVELRGQVVARRDHPLAGRAARPSPRRRCSPRRWRQPGRRSRCTPAGRPPHRDRPTR